MSTPAESVAGIAAGMVTGDRMDDYGHPFHQHTLYGKVWADLLGLPEPIPPKMVALLLVAMKVCRETIKPKRDNLIDACGYAVCADMIDEYKRPKSPTPDFAPCGVKDCAICEIVRDGCRG